MTDWQINPTYVALPDCLTAEEHALAVSLCAPVKGLGLTLLRTPQMTLSRTAAIRRDPCQAMRLPVCPPKSVFQPVTFHQPVDSGGGPVEEDEPGVLRQRGLLVGSILLLVLAGGGYTIYRQTKKKKRRR